MKERPILFGGWAIPKILDGSKTQTRRVRKGNTSGLCPYGYPGDRLWVRETFCIESSREVGPYEPPFKDGRPCRWHENDAWGFYWEQPHYRATDPTPELEIGTGDPGVKWSPSIHMPRWASRITLEIVSVRVERVQEISETDAGAEGVDWYSIENKIDGIERCQQAFIKLWNSINAKRGFGWDENPHVRVIEFKKL